MFRYKIIYTNPIVIIPKPNKKKKIRDINITYNSVFLYPVFYYCKYFLSSNLTSLIASNFLVILSAVIETFSTSLLTV